MLFFRTVLDVAAGPMILLNPITLFFLGIAAIFLGQSFFLCDLGLRV